MIMLRRMNGIVGVDYSSVLAGLLSARYSFFETTVPSSPSPKILASIITVKQRLNDNLTTVEVVEQRSNNRLITVE